MLENDLTAMVVLATTVGMSFALMKHVLDYSLKVIKERKNGGKGSNPSSHIKDIKEKVGDIHEVVMEQVPGMPGQKLVWKGNDVELKGEITSLREEVKKLASAIDALSGIVSENRGSNNEVMNFLRELRKA